MRPWTILFSLVVGCLVAVNAFAQGNACKKHPLRDRFEKMDTNHDGILTVQEFVAAHPKMGEAKATTFYKELATLGGTTTAKSGVTGMTFPQFKKAHKAWKEAHSQQGQKQKSTS
jgi:Ca2+-binding EF-hand superfamily protein